MGRRERAAEKVAQLHPENDSTEDVVMTDILSRVPRLLDQVELLIGAAVEETTRTSTNDVQNGTTAATDEHIELGNKLATLKIKLQIQKMEKMLAGDIEDDPDEYTPSC